MIALSISLIESALIWLVETAFILAVFGLAIEPIVDRYTRNSWIKLPVKVAIGIVAGAFMAWLHYMPWVLFFLWLAVNKYYLANMRDPKFEEEAHLVIRRSVFYVSSYAYVVVACGAALFLQGEVLRSIPAHALVILDTQKHVYYAPACLPDDYAPRDVNSIPSLPPRDSMRFVVMPVSNASAAHADPDRRCVNMGEFWDQERLAEYVIGSRLYKSRWNADGTWNW